MTEQQQKELFRLTERLEELNEEAYNHHTIYSVNGTEPDFYEEVKPFADKVKDTLEKWTPLVLKWIEFYKPHDLYPSQVDQLAENFEILSVTCFQKDSKKKKLMERYKSIEYTLSLITIPSDLKE